MIKLGNYFLMRKNRFNIKNYIKEYSDVDDSLLKNNDQYIAIWRYTYI